MRNTQLPPPAPREQRVTDEWKAMKEGENLLLEKESAACLRAYWRNRGVKTVQRTEGDRVRVWRLA